MTPAPKGYRHLLQAGVVLGIVATWALLSGLRLYPESIFPSPLAVARGLVEELRSGRGERRDRLPLPRLGRLRAGRGPGHPHGPRPRPFRDGPLKLREQGLKVKIAYLGHRDGSTVMVRTDLPARSLKDLEGRTFALPSKYSNQNLVIRKLMGDEGVDPAKIRFVEMPPPDMPGALAAKAIDAYFVGEPHAARAELDGSGRVLYHAKDIWPRFISCVLVVTEKLVEERPAVVKDLVRGIAESGEWAERNRLDAAKVVSPYFRQDEALVRYVLTQPPDRVSYRTLTPEDHEMQQIADMGLAAGILERRLDVRDLVDRRFIPAEIRPARIDLARAE